MTRENGTQDADEQTEFDRRVAALTKLRESDAERRERQVAAERRRRRQRRIFVLVAVPLAALMGFAGCKLIAQHIVANVVTEQYAHGDFEGALNTASQLHWLNVVETWKADYNTGTSLLGAKAYDQAREAFERSLNLAPPREQCPIRANLAITIESQGDDAYFKSDLENAHARYVEALAAITEADPTCVDSTAAGSMSESEPRIREKIRRLEQQSPPQPQPNEEGGNDKPQPGDPKPDSLDEIEQDLEKNRDQREDELDGDYFGGGADKPW
ncbi:hypothetical protein [uncultured Gulosibacter sp.]|uniref:hypothetical protein n=1 Tax=uncultured Gulosibacter sp. TaxID=1339167 RepID=UPI00288AAEAE|nr:hypothetical protein [uncultured Gulosibacter sp.]